MENYLSKVESSLIGSIEPRIDVDRLRESLAHVNNLMDKAEWWRFKEPLIANLLMQLRDATYDADDVIAQFDYYQLKHNIEGQFTSQLLSSLGALIHYLGINWASKIKDAQTKLDSISGDLQSVISSLGSPDEPNPYGKAVQRETSSYIPEPMLGREEEVEMVVKLMLQPGDGVGSSNEASCSSSSRVKRRKACNFSVLPIVGVGGIGKTTLAQQIYNDERVKNHFDLRIWVYVSDYFDLKQITRDMIESANRELVAKGELRNYEKQVGIGVKHTNLDSLQQILKGKVLLRRFLLVLDDVWHEQSRDWEVLCNPLSSGCEGSMILITTRFSKVAEVMGTLDPIQLGGLPDVIYWKLFKNCAFRSDDTSSYPELEGMGKRIAAKLKGSPLAAKTLGRILCSNMTMEHWRAILDMEFWQLKHDVDGILAALQVSYLYLPADLKRCFLICSLFPKGFPLSEYRLSPVWMADGIIPHEKNIFYPKGKEYLGELESRSFILRDQCETLVLHDLMHDLAKSLSLNTCCYLDDNSWSLENHNSVRHLSVDRKPIGLIDMEIGRFKKLRSLLFLYGSFYKFWPSTLASLFSRLPYLRILDLKKCEILELPENIGNLKLLFHINLKDTRIRGLPRSLCQLYNLQVVNVEGCPIETFPKMFHNLINLRLITEEMEVSSKIPGIGKLTSLETLPEFKVLKMDGHKIEELKNMSRLRGCLMISNLESVGNMRDAAQACLNNKEYLTQLSLSWSPGRNTSRDWRIFIDEDIIEGLEPHPNLKALFIYKYGGRKPASWLRVEKLPHLRELGIEGCSNLENLEDWFMPHQLLSLQSLKITNCPLLSCLGKLILPSSLAVLKLDSCGEFDKSLPSCLKNVHSLRRLELYNCLHVTSLPSQVTNHLETLRFTNCAELQCIELSNPSILEELSIQRCPKLIQSDPLTADKEAPVPQMKHLCTLKIDNTSLLKLPFLRNPPRSLGKLWISDSPEERMFKGDVHGWLNGPENLKELYFIDCVNLELLPEELHTLVTVERMDIRNCPKIQSLRENGLPPSLNALFFSGCHPALTVQLEQHEAIMEGKRNGLEKELL